MRERHPARLFAFLLVAFLLAPASWHAARAQERWLPWQNYDEAKEATPAPRLKRGSKKAQKTGPSTKARLGQKSIESLNLKVVQLYQAGKYAEAVPIAEHALALAERLNGPDHSSVGTGLDNLALIHKSRGRYREAEPLYNRALAIREKALGPDHPDVGTSLNNLAGLYYVQARYTEAETLLKRAVAITEMLGPGHPAIGTSLLDLAGLYWAQGRYTAAEPLYNRALAIREKALGPDHPDVGTAVLNLAGLYWAQGRYTAAEPLYNRALAIREKALGPDHPDVGTAVVSLAGLYWAQGRYSEAGPLYNRALAIREKALGPDHPDLATLLNNIGELYRAQARYAEAEPLYNRALAVREKALGPDHPDVGTLLSNLGERYRAQARYAEAEPLYNRALAIREKALGPDHPDVATSLNNLAGLYVTDSRDIAEAERLYRYAKAERLYSRALSLSVRALGHDHPTVALIRGNLGAFLKSEGRISDAEPLLTLALERAEKELGPEHPQVVNAMIQLAELYGIQGRKDAVQLFARAGVLNSMGLQEFPIYFATNRQLDATQKRIAFGSERNLRKLTFGLIKVVVPPIAPPRRAQRMARPAPEITISDVRRLAIQPAQLLDAPLLVREARRRIFGARTYLGQALVFVHGYNVSFDNAMRRAGQLAYDLSFDGPVFVFSWPSRGSLTGYFDDRESAEISGEKLKDFLRLVVAETKASKIHVIAHSMGNITVKAALDRLDRDTAERLVIGEMIHAAPDIDPELFAQTFPRQQAKGTKSTVYASSADRALDLSRRLRDRPPLGLISSDGPTLVSGIDTIDITDAGFSLFGLNHDVYAASPAILADMQRLLKGGQGTPDRRPKEFELMVLKQGTYWRYRGPGAGLEQAAKLP